MAARVVSIDRTTRGLEITVEGVDPALAQRYRWLVEEHLKAHDRDGSPLPEWILSALVAAPGASRPVESAAGGKRNGKERPTATEVAVIDAVERAYRSGVADAAAVQAWIDRGNE